MYTDEDLDLAVEKGVFSKASVTEFRDLLNKTTDSPMVDEENFRLIGGFNDIFIVIACSLLLFSSLWVLRSISLSLSLCVFVGLSWGLSEFFVRKRKMALPSIMLMFAFVGGVFNLYLAWAAVPSETISLTEEMPHSLAVVVAIVISAIAAGLHWWRFRVPITIAVGTAATMAVLALVVLAVFPITRDYWAYIIFACGISAFLFAMYWDASDTTRTTRRSDVAFWLHLLSAPLIIHPIFSSLNIFKSESLASMVVVVLLYIFMTIMSLAIDRRALMVSSLAYAIFALSTIVKSYGSEGSSFPMTGIFMGALLVLLSVYWHSAREKVLLLFPQAVKKYLPE